MGVNEQSSLFVSFLFVYFVFLISFCRLTDVNIFHQGYPGSDERGGACTIKLFTAVINDVS